MMPDDPDGEQPAPEPPAPQPAPEAARSGGGRRLLAAVVPVPWMLGYGITGAWAITRGARGVSAGLAQVDVGYTRMVTPASVLYVGALLLTAFGVLLACSLLLIYDQRSPMPWIPVLFVAAGLAAGAVWAAARGDLSPGLWLLFFTGLVYVVVVAAVRVTRASRHARPGGIAEP